MSFTDCVESAVKAGRISREQAEDLFARQQDANHRFRLDAQHSPESAARMAEELGIERAKQNVRLQKYQAALQAIRNAENSNRVLAHPAGPTFAVRTIIARDSKGFYTQGNIYTDAVNIRGQAEANLAEGLSKMRSRWAGMYRDKVMLDAVIRELHGEATGHADGAIFAKAWAKTAEDLRLRFNRAGGAIPKRPDWAMPQMHDATLVGRASVGEWVDFVMERVNIERMIDAETGAAFTPDTLKLTLQGVYETIRTNGLSDMNPGAMNGKKLANRRQEARFLVFRDADSWLEYQDRFGSNNLFATLMDHMSNMAREIALLERLGPNPTASFRYLQDIARKAEDKPLARAHNEAIFRLVNGTGDENRSNLFGHVMGATRNWLGVAPKLGGAALSAIADQAFMSLTARWTGTSFTRTFGRFLAQLNPANEADRVLATRVGITGLSSTSAYSNVGRFSELAGGGAGVAGKVAHAGAAVAEAVLRVTGLNALTDGGRRAFVLEYSANMAENFGKRLDDIEGNFRLSMVERGITPEDWDIIRQTKTADHKGARFFVVDELMAREDLPISQRQRLAGKVQSIFNEELLHAVPEPDALARVFTTGGGMPGGSIAGEVGRTVALFKSFPIAVLSLHVSRALAARQLRGNMTAAAYAAHAIIATTLFGYVAMSLKQIARGKDPHNVDDPNTWGAAFMQGGGAGIFGDFLFNDVNRFGGGIMSTAVGPMGQTIDETTRLTIGNIQELVKGEDTNFTTELLRYVSNYQPGASIWYTRLLLEREIIDQLELAFDPNAAQRRFNNSERRVNDAGTAYWWRPGETTPERAPDLEIVE